MTENQTPEQQERERQERRELAIAEFNRQLHNPPNKVQVSRLDTFADVNRRIREAAGYPRRGKTGDDAA